MRATAAFAAGPASALAALLAAAPAAAGPLRVGDAVLEPVAIESLAGFPGQAPALALDAFRRVCASPPAAAAPAAFGSAADLGAACAMAATLDPDASARFFATAFDAYRVVRPAQASLPERREGFLTGYFEPELAGALASDAAFATPVLARPDDLVALAPGETRPGLDPAMRAARAAGTGFEPYPDRAAIEDGALGALARPVLYLRDAVDLFVLQVQGSGRVRLPDGRVVRVLYDGRNGRPYSSVAKRIVSEGHLPLEGLTLARWTGWLRDHPAEGRRLMRSNASYVFFRLAEVEDAALGPPGAAGAALVPDHSLAVDAGLWRYGLPFWLQGGGVEGRIAIAADTGSAILGPARGDLYLGTGAVAGAAAGELRATIGFVVLVPKPRPGGP